MPALINNQIFTASQIAFALGRSRQSLNRLLHGISEDGKLLVRGNLTQAWLIQRLPPQLRGDLETAAQRKGFRSIEHMMESPAEPWQPKIPICEVDPKYITKATQLRDALAASLARRNDESLSGAEFDQKGAEDYAKSFGFAVSVRHWRRLFDRTVARDRGLEQWTRLELYFDDNVGRKSPRPTLTTSVRFVHSCLDELIGSLENKAEPTSADREFLLDAAFQSYENFNTASPEQDKQRAFKKSLLHYLFSAVPGLSKTPKALRWMFNAKYADWKKNGCSPTAIADLRRLKSGNFRKIDISTDKKKIRDEAILLGGNESLAYRNLRNAGKLSPEFTEHFAFDPRLNKSYVPNEVRSDITREVEMCGPLHRGPWEAKMRGPYIPRDWSDVQPGDWFSGDDVTWNSYFWFNDENGQPQISRGECLVLCDLRTGYLLDYILIAGKYNSRHIRSVFLKVHDKHGLPHKGMYLERGVWKSKFVAGDLRANESFHWRETERGLTEKGVGLEVRHATTPRAKNIEGLFHILQDTQRKEPGFVGFNERTEKMERMQEFILRVKSGKEHPGNEMWEMSQWTKRLDTIFSDFNSDPQNGKMLQGQSPAEMWQEGLNRRPLIKLPEDSRYLLSTHKKPVKVRQEGIILNIGGERMLYCNERTGNLIGQEVLAFYNIDFPDLLTVSDLNRQNYFTVKRISLPAMSATKEQFTEVHTQIAGHKKLAKTIYGNIQHPVVATVSHDNRQTEENKELGRFHNEEVEQFKTTQSETVRKLRKIQTVAASSGIAIGQHIRNPDRVLQGLELEKAILARLESSESLISKEKPNV